LAVAPEPVTLIALGPLTNVAAAIEQDWAAMATAKRVVVMGGAFAVSGNVTPAAEFNIYVDPDAAKIVFQSGIPLTVVPLDVTRQVILTQETLAMATASRPTPIGQFLRDCTAELISDAGEGGTPGSLTLHDPLAVGVVIDPSFVVTEALPVEIETRGEVAEGMTVADRRPLSATAKAPPNAEVCVRVDGPRFLDFFLERVLGTGQE
jgi:inosine-uridine nucleoside N-ribohydrolase